MKKLTYSDKLKSPKWQKKRLEIMSRDKFTCKKCGDTESQLHVHHKEYIDGNDPWDYENNMLITLCEHCHKEIELEKIKYSSDFNNIEIYKSTGWADGSRIMFLSEFEKCSMTIYDKNDEFIIGFDFTNVDDIENIIKIFKATT